jgi:hypothetical protein
MFLHSKRLLCVVPPIHRWDEDRCDHVTQTERKCDQIRDMRALYIRFLIALASGYLNGGCKAWDGSMSTCSICASAVTEFMTARPRLNRARLIRTAPGSVAA